MLLGLGAWLTSCTVDRTQLLVGVDTDLSWGPTGVIQSVTLELRRGDQDGALRSRRTSALGEASGRQALPLWVTVVPTDESDASPLWVEALGCATPDGCTRETAVVTQRASVRFVAGQTGMLRLLLAGACRARRCAQNERCAVATGQCIGVDAQGEVRAYGGTLPGRWADASVPGDALAVDAPTDRVTPADAIMQPDGSIADALDVQLATDLPDVRMATDLPDVPDVPADVSCPSGQVMCGSAGCVSTDSDPSNCGRCGAVCSIGHVTGTACAAGACVGTCASGWADCNRDLRSDGCEAAIGASCSAGVGACLRSGTAVCSGITTACNAVAAAPGTEICDSVDNDCDGLIDEGFCRIGGVCYTNGQRNSTTDCQVCTAPTTASAPTIWSFAMPGTTCRPSVGPCDAAETCAGSSLTCPTDLAMPTSTTCPSPTGGVCAGVTTCACPAGQSNCSGLCNATGAACVSPGSSPSCRVSGTMVCSGTGTACSATAPRTSGTCTEITGGVCDPTGACSLACAAGQTNCSGACRDLATDSGNCGACGSPCPAGQACTASACVVTQRSCVVVGTPGCGLVAISGGTFTMGEAALAVGASPVQNGIVVGNFSLDAYEVTVARFNAFWSVRAAVLTTIRGTSIAYPGGQSIAWGASAQAPATQSSWAVYNWSASSSARDAHPMNGVDWWSAQEFCVWDGGRLPTEAEWEYAARGRVMSGLSAGRVYPWGDTDPSSACDRALWNGCAGTDGGVTRRVGGFAPAGGLYDLAGSVWEWTADNYGTYPSCRMSTTNPLCDNTATGNRVIRGGSWNPGAIAYVRSASRFSITPANRSYDLGFRCARTTP